MVDQAYTESAWHRGWNDTKRWLGAWQFWFVEVFGGGFFGILTQSAAAALWFVGAVFMALWIGATVSAPVRQRNEARAVLRQVADSRSNMDLLGNLIKEGRELRYATVANDEELPEWLAQYDSWVDDGGAIIEAVFSRAEKELFNTVEGIMAADIGGSFNGLHNNKRLIIDRRLATLRSLVERQGDL